MYNYGQRSSKPGYGQNRSGGGKPVVAKPIEPKTIPDNYVDEAENVIKLLAERKKSEIITTNKIRNLLSFSSNIYNVENLSSKDAISDASANALVQMRIRTVYECGRDKAVKIFVENAQLLEYLKGLNKNRKLVINFCHYMEALVAYHRYYCGGKEG